MFLQQIFKSEFVVPCPVPLLYSTGICILESCKLGWVLLQRTSIFIAVHISLSAYSFDAQQNRKKKEKIKEKKTQNLFLLWQNIWNKHIAWLFHLHFYFKIQILNLFY